MTDEKPPEPTSTTDSVSSDANDWYRDFCKNLDLNFIPSASVLSFELNTTDHQIATLRAVLQTLVESGMMAEAIRKEVDLLFSAASDANKPDRKFGLGKGKLAIISDDEEHLDHFHDYLP